MKNVIVFSVLLFLVFGSFLLFAQEDQSAATGAVLETPPPMMADCPMMRGKMKGMGKMGMGEGWGKGKKDSPFMKAFSEALFEREMVAVDGGVIVMNGDKLIKFDSGLNKVKEIELEVNIENIAAKMKQMYEMKRKMKMEMREEMGKGKCPMMDSGEDSDSEDEATGDDSGIDIETPGWIKK